MRMGLMHLRLADSKFFRPTVILGVDNNWKIAEDCGLSRRKKTNAEKLGK